MVNVAARWLAVLGASGHGKVIADLAELLGYQVTFFDARWPQVKQNGCWPVEGDEQALVSRRAEFAALVVAIGNNRVRAERQLHLEKEGFPLATLIHPSAVVSRYAKVGAGSVVFANAVINADARVGKGAIINTGATVDHDCQLGDFVHISPGAHLAGNVVVGAGSWVGIGAAVRQGITIGKDVMIGAGAAVVSDIPDGLCVVGVPARPLAR